MVINDVYTQHCPLIGLQFPTLKILCLLLAVKRKKIKKYVNKLQHTIGLGGCLNTSHHHIYKIIIMKDFKCTTNYNLLTFPTQLLFSFISVSMLEK